MTTTLSLKGRCTVTSFNCTLLRSAWAAGAIKTSTIGTTPQAATNLPQIHACFTLLPTEVRARGMRAREVVTGGIDAGNTLIPDSCYAGFQTGVRRRRPQRDGVLKVLALRSMPSTCAAWHRPGAAHPSCRPGASRPARGQLRHGRRRQIGRTPAQRDRACRRCARTRRLIEQAFQCLQAHALFVDGALLSGERQLVLVLRAKNGGMVT